MIVPDRSDLNVYKTASKDGGEVGCCGPSSSGKTNGCGSKKREVVDADLKDVDLNEWAGKSEICPMSITVVKLTCSRLLQNIRCQGMKQSEHTKNILSIKVKLCQTSVLAGPKNSMRNLKR